MKKTILMSGLTLALALSACSGSGTDSSSGSDGGGGGGGGASGWHVIAPPPNQNPANMRGVYCSAADKCVVATSEGIMEGLSSDKGAVYAMNGTEVQPTKLLDGTYQGALSNVSNVLGDIDFIGFTATRNGVVARTDISGVYAISSGDITQQSSWSFVNMGSSDGDSLSGNNFANIQENNNTWLFVNTGFLYSATSAPSAGTAWTKVWGPPTVPANFETQLAADPSLCDSNVTAGGVFLPSNPIYIAQDLSVIVGVTGGLNVRSKSSPGVCISTDQGQHFYNVAFSGVPTDTSNPGPKGVTCTDKDHCYAYNGKGFDTAYIYYTSNASAGKNSTWTAATVPSSWASSQQAITLQALFFAPDRTHGWAVGNSDHNSLLVRTTDSGHTWTDVSSQVGGLSNSADLYDGFAVDADHVWVVGRFGFIAATTTAQL